ncbi:MAG: lytic transglycosylase domain-containing protein [Bdellovibrionales bacterium]
MHRPFTLLLLCFSLLLPAAAAAYEALPAPLLVAEKKPAAKKAPAKKAAAKKSAPKKTVPQRMAPSSDRLLNDVARAEAFLAGSGSYEAIASFLQRYPVWPDRRGLIAAAENFLTPAAPPADMDSLYKGKDNKPVTLNGFETYINFLLQQNRNAEAADLVRDRWINGPLATGDDMAFRRRYAQFISADDDVARLDRLLWEEEYSAARNLYPLIGAGYEALAEARMALQKGAGDASRKLERVPARLLDDPGLAYARIVYRSERGDTQGAADILQQVQTAEGRPDLWWKARHIIIRRSIERRDFGLAYRLARQHGLVDAAKKYPAPFADAEFMAGWLALRFHDEPRAAAAHFQNVYDNVNSPMSKSRGAYWLGRAYEAAGDTSRARDAYQQAAVHHAFFYGQLAIAKLDNNPVLALPPEPQIPANARGSFMAEPLPAIISKLTARGDKERATKFLRVLLAALDTRAEFVLAGELARKIAPEQEVEAAKAANQKGYILYTAGYPRRSVPSDGGVEPALALGLIRQESQFKSDAVSHAGAIGLMQLLPSSARATARKHGYRWGGNASLKNPDTNIRLGRAYLNDRIRQFDGSYILAIAAYNGGQGRVRQWLETFGDPRVPTAQGGADPIDWIEIIPIYETRNYVQRVLENTQVYRTLLTGSDSDTSAPLKIVQDLRR